LAVVTEGSFPQKNPTLKEQAQRGGSGEKKNLHKRPVRACKLVGVAKTGGVTIAAGSQ